MKILITGGTGFVGRNLQQTLKQQNIDFVVFHQSQYDLAVPDQADAVFRLHRDADAIIHLASYQAAGSFPAQHPAQQFYINNQIHLNTLEAWRNHLPGAKLLAVGTSCAYPSSGQLVEDRFLDGDIHGSVYAYAFTKRLLYQGIVAYNDQYGLNGSYIIPATMFGPFDDFHRDTAHVVGALIGKFVSATVEQLPEVEIWGDGTQVRDFMSVQDFTQTLLSLLDQCDHDILNVGPGVGTAIGDLAKMIAKAAKYPYELRFNSQKYVGIDKKVIDVNKLNKQYQITIESNHESAIQEAVDWYQQHYPQLKNKQKFAMLGATQAA